MKERAPIVLRKPDTCQHKAWEVDPDMPVVECADCKKALDPWWCLRQMAGAYHKMDYRLEDWQRMVEQQRAANERILALREKRRQRQAGIRGVTGGTSA